MELDWTHSEKGMRKLKGWNWIEHIMRKEGETKGMEVDWTHPG